MNNRLEKWDRWLVSIYKEITNLSHYRHIFLEVQKIINNNQKINKPNVFYVYFIMSYTALVLMGIRRQVKFNRNSISFAMFLKEISESPKFLSENHINPEEVEKDIDDLQKKAKLCEKFADKTIAHHDIQKPIIIPKFKDVNDSIDFLEELIKKYYSLFHAQSLFSTTPIIIGN